MNQNLRPLLSLFLFFCFSSIAAAQTQDSAQAGPDHEATLYILLDGQEAAPAKMPDRLSAIANRIARDHGAGNLRLAAVFTGRAGQNGMIDARGIMQLSQSERTRGNMMNWGVQALRSGDSLAGAEFVKAANFRFAIRVPVSTLMRDPQTDQEKLSGFSDILHLTASQINLAKDTPTLIGSITLSQPERVLYIILNVREAR